MRWAHGLLRCLGRHSQQGNANSSIDTLSQKEVVEQVGYASEHGAGDQDDGPRYHEHPRPIFVIQPSHKTTLVGFSISMQT